MPNNYRTEQEQFWAGEFGDTYIERNSYENKTLISANVSLFSKVLQRCQSIESVIEFGANIGLNLAAINLLIPELSDISAVEINKKAADILQSQLHCKHVYQQSLFDFNVDYCRDFVLIKGVMIHLNPDCLSEAYDILYRTTKRYLCVAEYYNPTPVTIPYRNNADRLFKRDFAGELLDRYPDLSLLDYGFSYHRDRHFPQDDITWFLLEKKQ